MDSLFFTYYSPLFVRSEGSQTASLLIIQCDSGHLNGDLIACARYRIYNVRAKALLKKYQTTHTTHVLFIIHLPVQTVQSSFVGFQGDPWISCHIDELRRSEKGAITLEGAQGVPMSILFYGGLEDDKRKETLSEMYTQCVHLNNCIQAAASRLQNYTQNKDRTAEQVKLLIELIPRKPVFPLGIYYMYMP